MIGKADIESKTSLMEVHDWIRGLERQRSPGINFVPVIEEKIETESNVGRLQVLRFFLASELALHGRLLDAEAVYTRMHEDFPDDPLPLISLASQKLYDQDGLEKALPFVDKAVEVAYRSGNFRRNALGVKARIALALERYDLVEDILRQILSLRTEPGHVDCGVERDFLDRLPVGVIDEEVRRQYAELRRQYEQHSRGRRHAPPS
jgi:tetratricopeptide (TPR) repeat protein